MDDTRATAEGPWYREGLCFACTGCGNCCTGTPGVVWVNDEEIRAIAELTGKGEGEIRVMHTRPFAGRTSLLEHANGDCTFFDPEHRRCTIYPARPRQCRSWPFWPSNLASPEDWTAVQGDCPGAGTGPLIPSEEIDVLAGLIDI